MSEPRACAVCGKELARREGEKSGNWQKRKTCCLACAHVATGRGISKPWVAETRLCEICGDPIPYIGEEL